MGRIVQLPSSLHSHFGKPSKGLELSGAEVLNLGTEALAEELSGELVGGSLRVVHPVAHSA